MIRIFCIIISFVYLSACATRQNSAPIEYHHKHSDGSGYGSRYSAYKSKKIYDDYADDEEDSNSINSEDTRPMVEEGGAVIATKELRTESHDEVILPEPKQQEAHQTMVLPGDEPLEPEVSAPMLTKDQKIIYHEVQSGENLDEIAEQYNQTKSEIVQLNQLNPPYELEDGQILKIKVKTQGPASHGANDQAPNTLKSAAPAPVTLSDQELDQELESIDNIQPNAPMSSAPESAFGSAVATAPQAAAMAQNLATKVSDSPGAVAENPEDEHVIPAVIQKPNQDLMQNENPALPAGKAQEYIAPVKGKILSKFGEKTDSGVNKGIAIAAKAGTPVVATASGKVIYADYDAVFGNLVIVKLNNKNVITSYAHLEKFMINKGAQVSQGDVIGYVGNSGKASEPQLNFGIREGKVAQDPTKFINFGQKAPSQAKAPAGKAPANKAPGAKKPSAKAAKKNTGA